MRVTSGMYYKSLYSQNNSQLNSKLFDVNKQIASGLRIQYAQDDVAAFTETMRLDNEVTTLDQVKQSTESGYKISNQTDVILTEFTDSMDRLRTLFVNAGNDSHSDLSRDAIADEMRIIEDHFRNLSNTSINGQYLFSGTAVDIKPISDDGTYNGNDGSMSSFLGSSTQQQHNISGAELFLGEEVLVRRQVTTNVVQNDLTQKYDYATGTDNGSLATPVTVDSTIRDLMGDTDDVVDVGTAKHHFYVRGVQSDGTAFDTKISMSDEQTIDDLLTNIGTAYGNTGNLNVVNVSLNVNGQIVVEDKRQGSSKLDFHMVGAVDYTGGGAADVTNIDLLDNGEVDFSKIMDGTTTAANPNLHVKEFVKSDIDPATGAPANIDGLLYDRTQFDKKGSSLSSNVAQIVKSDNSFATDSTKISEVADLSQGNAGTLDGTQFTLSGTNVNGAAFDVQIDFATTGSTFSLDGGVTNYDIFNMESPRIAVDGDDMTYRQVMDIVNMVVTDNIPASTNVDTDYDDAIKASTFSGTTYLSYDGKLQFQELNSTTTDATISLYDSVSGNYGLNFDSDGDTIPDMHASSVMSFNTNNALTIRDPKTDFFKELDKMITAVENHKNYPDSEGGDIRSVGIENAITMLDDLQDHISRSHSVVGAQSNALTTSLERTEILRISTMTLRSSVVDTDIAEASLTLTQLTLNYEAMLSTVGKISKLSLVNYI